MLKYRIKILKEKVTCVICQQEKCASILYFKSEKEDGSPRTEEKTLCPKCYLALEESLEPPKFEYCKTCISKSCKYIDIYLNNKGICAFYCDCTAFDDRGSFYDVDDLEYLDDKGLE